MLERMTSLNYYLFNSSVDLRRGTFCLYAKYKESDLQ